MPTASDSARHTPGRPQGLWGNQVKAWDQHDPNHGLVWGGGAKSDYSAYTATGSSGLWGSSASPAGYTDCLSRPGATGCPAPH
eukprot:CAMPEP_0173390782 /NCGR_PEP_ID=MMETSP1356-20130122/16131_1 /TAXON_ID=77927 ORGANISM="Hemiselmis virescens, Strain PCC157" /NCGR_SAMPLE_ID=MMETSP1356 /ASSEMBLY_ACC=CAM_ASM_000847 /LENGTH=82 /DNA_ID=CAMNT_0014348253 /DNA_START=34 /DNA_END=282 /DNA_ORIENTATION=+